MRKTSKYELADLASLPLKEGQSLGAQDISSLAAAISERMIRFSNNSVTVVKNLEEISLTVYVGFSGRRIVGSTSDITKGGVRALVRNLFRSARTVTPAPVYASLPKGSFKYPKVFFDEGVAAPDTSHSDFAREAIDAALEAGAVRAAGSLTATDTSYAIATSGGAEAEDRSTSILINVRAFADGEASGQGLSCSSTLSEFRPGEAGYTAGDFARKAAKPKPFEEGTYDVIYSSTVAADIFSTTASFASAFLVDAGLSFLADQLGKQVAVEGLSIEDSATAEGALYRRVFDDEGVPTRRTPIIEEGQLKTYLHNSTTAAKFNSKSTANAGFVDPHPWNVVVKAGDYSLEEMIKEVDKGFILTNNWYTRFQSFREGAYSTVPRDAAFYIEGGEIRYPVSGLRVSDTIPRQLQNVALLTKERQWVQWWEVNVPTLCPAVLIRRVKITKAVT